MIVGWSFVPGKPVVRGYDTSPLFREDCLEQIRQLQLQFEADMRRLAQLKKEYDAAEERLRRRKKGFGWSG